MIYIVLPFSHLICDTSTIQCSPISCVYVLKYMLEWNGVEMRHDFLLVRMLKYKFTYLDSSTEVHIHFY